VTVIAHEADVGALKTETARTSAGPTSRELLQQARARLRVEVGIRLRLMDAGRATALRTWPAPLARLRRATRRGLGRCVRGIIEDGQR
jgi:hypothetical protein